MKQYFNHHSGDDDDYDLKSDRLYNNMALATHGAYCNDYAQNAPTGAEGHPKTPIRTLLVTLRAPKAIQSIPKVYQKP